MQNPCVLILVYLASLLVSGSSGQQLYDPTINHFQDNELMRTWWPSEGTNTTTDSGILIKGFSCLGLSVIGFGSSLVPIKRTETGDGMFFQLVFCNTLSLESLIVYVILGCPSIWSLSLLGGFLFATANLTTIPIIKTIGLGMGVLIWATFSLLMAWATARFGWFGLDPQDVPSSTLNYIGTGFVTVSALILFFVKTENEKEDAEGEETKSLLQKNSGSNSQLDSLVDDYILSPTSTKSWSEKLRPMNRKIIGCSLATFAGLVYGCAYTPIIYIKNNSLKNGTSFPGASLYDLDYIFPYMTGINATTTIVFFVYCMVKKNRPCLPSNCVLPAFFSASMQFASQCAFFTACYCLGTVITYPIGNAGPALVSVIWSVFYFKEIRGMKNFLILAAVVVAVLSGVTMISLSKIGSY